MKLSIIVVVYNTVSCYNSDRLLLCYGCVLELRHWVLLLSVLFRRDVRQRHHYTAVVLLCGYVCCAGGANVEVYACPGISTGCRPPYDGLLGREGRLSFIYVLFVDGVTVLFDLGLLGVNQEPMSRTKPPGVAAVAAVSSLRAVADSDVCSVAVGSRGLLTCED